MDKRYSTRVLIDRYLLSFCFVDYRLLISVLPSEFWFARFIKVNFYLRATFFSAQIGIRSYYAFYGDNLQGFFYLKMAMATLFSAFPGVQSRICQPSFYCKYFTSFLNTFIEDKGTIEIFYQTFLKLLKVSEQEKIK